jgi:hypothetical protein
MKIESGILNRYKNADYTFYPIKLAADTLTVVKSKDSVTRSLIDPFLIANKKKSSQNENYFNFYNSYWQKIIKQEAQRENYSDVKVITPQTQIISNTKKYYFEGNSDWILAVGIILVVLIAWIRIYYGKVLAQTFRSTINLQSTRKLLAEKSSYLQKASMILITLYILGTGLFLYECINYYHIKLLNVESIYQFIICFASVLLFYLFKSLLYWISGFIVNAENEIMELLSNNNIFYRTVGILLLPIIISIPYVPDNIAEILLYCGVAVFCISFIMRVIRGFVVSFKIKLSLFYSFLYFCVLEILPILYILRIIKVVV